MPHQETDFIHMGVKKELWAGPGDPCREIAHLVCGKIRGEAF